MTSHTHTPQEQRQYGGQDPLLTGISQKTETKPFWRCMSVTTRHTNTRMGGCAACSLGQGKKLSCEPRAVTPDLFGETLLATAENTESTALFSETKARFCRPTLSDRQTQLLIRCGLVAGITPTSIRKQCGAAIPDSVIWPQAGVDAAKQKGGK